MKVPERHNRITWFGTIALLVNNVVGPGLAAIPRVFQTAGWVPSVVVMLFMTVLSYLSCLFLCETMLRIPGNKNYKKELEFLAVAKHYLGPWQYKATLILFIISLECLNMAAIVQSIQVTDDLLEKLFGASCGLQLWPKWDTLCSRDLDALDESIILSAGLVIFALITVPIGFLHLDDSIAVQQASFVVLLLIIVQWMFDFLDHEVHLDAVPPFAGDQHQVLGVIAFNYCFVTTIPSWVNRKRRNVDEDSSVMGSVLLSSGMFLLVGLWGGLTLVLSDNVDLLDVLSKEPSLLSALAVYLFPVVVNLAGIPVLCIIVRDNLVQEGLLGPRWASIISNLFPWLFTLPFYTGQGFQNLINWTGLLTLGLVNFVIPLAMFIKAMERDPVLDEGAYDAAPGTQKPPPPELAGLLASGSDSEGSESDSWESSEGSSGDETDGGSSRAPPRGAPTTDAASASRKMGADAAMAGARAQVSDADTNSGPAGCSSAGGKEIPASPAASRASNNAPAQHGARAEPGGGGGVAGGGGSGANAAGTRPPSAPENRGATNGIVALVVSTQENAGSKGFVSGSKGGVAVSNQKMSRDSGRSDTRCGPKDGDDDGKGDSDQEKEKRRKRRCRGPAADGAAPRGGVRRRSGRHSALPLWMEAAQWTWIARRLMWIFVAMLLFYISLNLYFVTAGEPFFMRVFGPGGGVQGGSTPGWMEEEVGSAGVAVTQFRGAHLGHIHKHDVPMGAHLHKVRPLLE